MLLVAVARLQGAVELGYAKVIALLCGLPVQECQATLTELSENGHIQHDFVGENLCLLDGRG